MNTILALALWAIALAFPRPVACPETLDAYTTRVATIVHAAALETRSPSEAAAVLVVFYAESTFRLDIHSGEKLGDSGRARCLGQVHPHAKDWHLLAGTDLESTQRCAAQAIRHLRWGRACTRKGGEVTRMAYAFAYYGAGHCTEPGAEARHRARMWAKTMAKLEKGGVL